MAQVPVVQASPRGRNPFDETLVERDAEGIARYLGRPASLVHMLRASVERDGSAIALVEVGGPSISYAELWVTETCWPDFRRDELIQALRDFAVRDRRFGGLKD